MYIYLAKILSLLLTVLLLASCASRFDGVELPKPLPDRAAGVDANADAHRKGVSDRPPLMTPDAMPVEKIESMSPVSFYDFNSKKRSTLTLPEGKLVLNADALPLNRFLHLALGDVLKLSFTIDPAIAARTEPVTLHVATAVSADRLLAMVGSALEAYQISLLQHASGVKVVPAAAVNRSQPEVLNGRQRTLVRLGRVMEFIPLRYAAPAEVLSISSFFMASGKLTATFNDRLKAIILIGEADAVKKIRKAIGAIDVPSMGGRQLRLIRPVYWQVEALIKVLEDTLLMQGVPIAKSAAAKGLHLLAIKETNALFASSSRADWLQALQDMVARLDTISAAGESDRSFIYFVHQTDAEGLGKVINEVLGNHNSSLSAPEDKKQKKTTATAKAQPALRASASLSGKRVIIDTQRNALIFVGSARAYRPVYAMLQRLDKPARQVLIEATVADVTLDASRQLGVEWQFTNVDNSASMLGTLSTIGGLGVAAGGLSYSIVNAAGSVRSKINALAATGDAKILSSPRLLAKHNQSAHMQIGTQISVVKSEAGDANGVAVGGTSILRTFEYVDTGVILDFTPFIFDDGRVELKISQEVSEAGASTNNSPPIFKRVIETTLVVESGQSIIIGGLITHNLTENITKVPFLGDIPLLGQLFSNSSTTDRSTELIVEITPHIISGPDEADYLSNAIKSQLNW